MSLELLGRYKNGNHITTILSDGSRERRTKDDEFTFDFAENMDIKIIDKCNMGCAFCHEGSTINGKIPDILNAKFIDTLHPYQEAALGGGNVLEHPDLVPFLRKLKEKKVIANITVHQKHFEENTDFIQKLVDEKLIYGIGISLVDPTDEFISKVERFPNAVIHLINGVVDFSDIIKLITNNMKLLILGFKDLRRGSVYHESNEKIIKRNQELLKRNISCVIELAKVASFDNLAIEQLDLKSVLPAEQWETFYQGDDGTSTYYIDMCEGKFAKSSTAPFDKRYDILDSVDDMFRIITSE